MDSKHPSKDSAGSLDQVVRRTLAIQFGILALICACSKGKDAAGATILMLLGMCCVIAAINYWPNRRDSPPNEKVSDPATP